MPNKKQFNLEGSFILWAQFLFLFLFLSYSLECAPIVSRDNKKLSYQTSESLNVRLEQLRRKEAQNLITLEESKEVEEINLELARRIPQVTGLPLPQHDTVIQEWSGNGTVINFSPLENK